jgi:comEA protein
MNNKERVVLLFLCISFVVGAGISFIRNKLDKRNLKAITVSQLPIANSQNNEITLININTASNKELEALPGIGPVLTQRIIEYRQKINGFKTKEELLKISGIGPKKFEAIKDKITIK